MPIINCFGTLFEKLSTAYAWTLSIIFNHTQSSFTHGVVNLVEQINGAKKNNSQKWRETSLCSIQLKAEPSHFIKGVDLFRLDPDSYLYECICTITVSIE